MTSRDKRPVVLLVGPDGSGKSALATNLKAELERQGTVTHFHWRPGILWRPDRTGDASSPHARTVRSALPTVVSIARTWLDYVIFCARRRLRRKTDVVLIERGMHDMRVDPRRYRLNPRASQLPLALATRALPRPDLAILLSGDADKIAQRKPELTREEIERQIASWRRILPRVSRWVELDTSNLNERQAADEALRRVANLPETRRHTHLRRVAVPGERTIAATSRIAARHLPYIPTRRKAHIAISIGRFLPLVGVHVPTCNVLEAISYCAREVGVTGRNVSFIGTPTSGSCVVGVHDDLGHLQAVAKISSAPLRLATEYEFTSRLHALAPSSFLVPTPITYGLIAETVGVYISEPINFSRALNRPAPSHDQLRYIAEELWCGTLGGQLTHGDFAPWNVASTQDGRLAVLDWEYASFAAGNPLYDVIHYVMQTALHVQHKSPESTASDILNPEQLVLRRAERIDGFSDTTLAAALAQYFEKSEAIISTPRARAFRHAVRAILAGHLPEDAA